MCKIGSRELKHAPPRRAVSSALHPEKLKPVSPNDVRQDQDAANQKEQIDGPGMQITRGETADK